MSDISPPRTDRLKFKFIFILTFVVFCISFLFSTFNLYYQKTNLINDLLKKGQLLTEILVQNVRIAVFSENKALLSKINEALLKQSDVVNVSVYNSEGILLKQSRKNQSIASEKKNLEDIKTLQQSLDVLKQSAKPFYKETPDYITFWSPVISRVSYFDSEPLYIYFEKRVKEEKNRIIGFAAVTLDKENFTRKVYNLFINCVSIGIICWIITLPIICLVSEKITEPLRHLTENVKNMGRGEKINHIPGNTKCEIGELAQAFNDMHLSLKKRERDKYQLERRLRQSHKLEALGSLSRSVTHELNNILGTIVGNAELVRAELPPGVAMKKKIQEILKACSKAQHLMDYLMIFSKKNEKNMKPVQMSIPVNEALKMLQVSMPGSIEIRTAIASVSTMVMSDSSQIYQIVMNLCTNAIEAMPDGGTLEVMLEDVYLDFDSVKKLGNIIPGHYVSLAVKDTGRGMTRDIEEKMFSPFFTTRKVHDGAGMGLSIVYGIVKNSHGAISVETQKENGTLVKILLPTIENDIIPFLS